MLLGVFARRDRTVRASDLEGVANQSFISWATDRVARSDMGLLQREKITYPMRMSTP